MSASVGTVVAAETVIESKRVRSIGRRILDAAWRMTSFKVGLLVFVLLLLASLIVPAISTVSATKMIVKDKFIPPLFLGDRWTWVLKPDQSSTFVTGGDIACIGSKPQSSLDPTVPVGSQIAEKLHSVRPE